MRKLLVIILMSLALLFVQSCENSCNMTRQIKLLTERKWINDTYIDYSINQEFSVIPEQYEFSADGSLTKIKSNDTIYGNWSIPECNYLKINAMTFKVAELSRKMMVLRYGDSDFIYRSVN
ncbi:MAG: hypothetical protein II575_12280 [Bacteroidales bacterium]|nr:hypothetical protein [Bacteroidales bacterium]MBQ2543116.1 hypothetical protein [Bacteroidales bacterium]MBQ2574992.1 hypothetical protein [Bacteroidales bacterium]